MTFGDSKILSSARALGCLAAFCVACALPVLPASAQENAISPPPPLEYPFQAKPEAPRAVSIGVFSYVIEQSADVALCQALMTADGKPIPSNFKPADCPPEYRAKVAANDGIVHWKSGARPTKCTNCIGRISMTAEKQTNKPNLRQATLYGRLTFVADPPGPTNRDINYSFQAFFTCRAENGKRDGKMVIDLKFDPPYLGEPGFWESAISFLTANQLSEFIEGKIKENLTNIGNIQTEQGACRSVGLDSGNAAKFDNVRFDPPAAATSPRVGAAVTSALRESATIRLIRITRNPLPVNVAPEHARPGDPFAGQFTIFANGVQNFLPPQGLTLPPEGGSVAVNFCKTIDLTGWNRLQLLFTNDLGGAVWSEFTRNQKFGAGGQRKITTGRRILLPVNSGPSVPGGPPASTKPTPYDLREFELTYEITFNASPVAVASPVTGSGGGRTGGAATGGATTGATAGGNTFQVAPGALGRTPQATVTQQPCVQL